MNVFGIDFTSRPTRRKPISSLHCTLEGDVSVPVIWKSGPISRRLSWRCKGLGRGSPALISRLARHDGLLKRSAGHAGGGITFAMHSL
jgi:hypothetical protein